MRLRAHTSNCKCQAAPTGVAWVANISHPGVSKVELDPEAATAARRCERDDLIYNSAEDINPSATVHLIVEQKTRLRMLHRHYTSGRLKLVRPMRTKLARSTKDVPYVYAI